MVSASSFLQLTQYTGDLNAHSSRGSSHYPGLNNSVIEHYIQLSTVTKQGYVRVTISPRELKTFSYVHDRMVATAVARGPV